MKDVHNFFAVQDKEIIDICLKHCPFPYCLEDDLGGCTYFVKKKKEVLQLKKQKEKENKRLKN